MVHGCAPHLSGLGSLSLNDVTVYVLAPRDLFNLTMKTVVLSYALLFLVPMEGAGG